MNHTITNHDETSANEALLLGNSLDLTVPEHAYMFGFFQADGHLYETTRNRGRPQVELSEIDETILSHFANLIQYPCSISKRTRRTNFAEEHRSVMLKVYDIRFRNELKVLGMIAGKKSSRVEAPQCLFSKVDYFRGVLDADGSLGITGRGFPFLSLVTASDSMAGNYLSFISQLIGKSKASARNSRDGVYNIVIYKEDAQILASSLYYEGCLALPRKKESAKAVLAWRRPPTMRLINFEKRRWNRDEDSYILTHTIEESSHALARTVRSIKTRLWRLRDK